MRCIEEKILQIIRQLPSESDFLDYKLNYYKSDKMSDFLVDVCAMLNCETSQNEDKYIVFGIANNKHQKGVLFSSIIDDAIFQELIDKIFPRPNINTGTVQLNNGNCFGYVFIGKENINRVYEIKEDYICSKSQVLSGQAFIRKGSRNFVLNNEERVNIYLDNIKKGIRVDKPENLCKIEAKLKLENNKYYNSALSDTVIFECSNNNGHYFVGLGEYLFGIQLYVVNNDVFHIRTLNGEKIGYSNLKTIPPKNQFFKENFNYSSFDRRLEKGEFVVLVNSQDKIATILNMGAKSKSHGADHNEITFNFKIYKD